MRFLFLLVEKGVVMNRKQTKIWMSGLILGGIFGGTIALLSAKRTGEEARELISEKSLDLREKAITTAEETGERVAEFKSNLIDGTRQKMNQIKESGQRIKKAESEVLKDCVEDAQKALVA